MSGTTFVEASKKEHTWGQIDADVLRSTLHELDRRLKEKFGDRYVNLILFGSRARGDHKPDSDADVAIVMRDPSEEDWPLTRMVSEETYELLLDTGLYIEPHLVDQDVIGAPETSKNPHLIREILRDGFVP